MNSVPRLNCISPLSVVVLASALVFTGCVSLPPEVKESVNETRTLVSELHKAHARDARAFARLVTQREVYLREFGDRLRAAFQAQIEAEVTASKIRSMAEFDRRSAELLGVQFQNRVRSHILARFNPLEHAAVLDLVDATAEKAALTNDPALGTKVTAKQRQVLQAQHRRDETVTYSFLSLDAALRTARVRFETEVEEKYNEMKKTFLEGLAAEANRGQALEEFEQRIDAKIAELDDAYYSVDHALSDLSTFLDSEATSTRFLKHTVKGFVGGLVDDLKGGQLGGVALSDLFGKKSQSFAKDLQGLETKLQDKADAVVKEAAEKVPLVSPTPVPDTAPIAAKQ